MNSERRAQRMVWVVLGIVVVGAVLYFGRSWYMPTNPEDAAMKVRRPVPPARRAPGQIGTGSATGPTGGGAGGGTAAPAGNTGGETDRP